MTDENGSVRREASILHLDLDAFFAAVEQRDKPSLRGKPVVVGGVGARGVVATASYEARKFGVRSAMSTAEARARCPHAAYLGGRFEVYRLTSSLVMAELRALSPLVEPLSLDEAFVDLAARTSNSDWSLPALREVAEGLRRDVHAATGGLTASVGIASSKLLAKIASELDKPDGAVVVAPGTEQELLRPMSVAVIPGVGPATTERLRRIGVNTVEALEQLSREELVRVLGRAHGNSLYALARADDDRAVISDRETKSISVEDTFESDLVEPALLAAIVHNHANNVCARLAKARLSGRTVTVKIKMHDFTTHTHSATLAGPTDRAAVVSKLARRLLAEVDTSSGVRLLGVGVSGLADWIQDDLFTDDEAPEVEEGPLPERSKVGERGPLSRGWPPGADVEHDELGRGWVWGSGLGRVTVRFETAATGPGPVHSFSSDDPALRRYDAAAALEAATPADPPPPRSVSTA